MALQGTTAVAGCPKDYVDGNYGQGAAYVFVQAGTTWSQQARLVAADGSAYQTLGSSVALDGDTLLVGMAPTPGMQLAAYVFVRTGTTWTQQAKLVASDGVIFDGFGSAVALSGSIAVIGAPNKTVGFNAAQGKAYVFVRTGTTWTEQLKLTAPDATAGDRFGSSLSLLGTTAMIGAPSKTIAANANQGAVYVFEQSGVTWPQKVRLTTADGASGDKFGTAAALRGDVALIAAASKSVGGRAGAGAAYVFLRSGPDWIQEQQIVANNTDPAGGFGTSVALAGSTAVIGQLGRTITENAGQGVAYVYNLTGLAGASCLGYAFCATPYTWADGVCCKKPCDGACDVCGAGGVCATLTQGATPTTPCPGNLLCNGTSGLCPASCTADLECGGNSFCTSAGTCQPVRANGAPCNLTGDCKVPGKCNICGSGKCADGVCCNSDCTGACDRCDLAITIGACTVVPKSPATACGTGYLCDGTLASCPGSCSGDSACQTGYFCSALTSKCTAQLTNGTVCDRTVQCQTGYCVDSVCCNSACEGTCQACSITYTGVASGQCVNTTAGVDPHNQCDQDSPTSCGQTGLCSNNGACASYGTSTACGNPSCIGNESRPRTCSSVGHCEPSANGTSCGAYLCQTSSGSCLAGCTNDTDCSTGYWCNAAQGKCLAKQASGACTSDTQCKAGHCVDEFCCDTACPGTCQACSSAKKGGGGDGICGDIVAGRDPDGECVDQGGASCGTNGTCGGHGACGYYAAAIACGATTPASQTRRTASPA